MAETNEQNTAQELYGANAIVAGPNDGPVVSVQSTNTQTFTVNTTEGQASGNPVGEPQGNQPSGQSPDKTTEEGTQQQQDQPAPSDDPGQATQQMQQQLEANKALADDLTSKGVDFTVLENEYEKTGDISKASREALAKAGYPEQVVNAYLSGLKASAEQFSNAVFKIAGGQQEFEAIKAHVVTMGAGAISAFNAAINSGDVNQVGLVLQGIKASLKDTRGTANPTVMGTSPSVGGTPQGFKDKAEMIHAMSDKRYGRDPAYTKAVEAKLLKTNL